MNCPLNIRLSSSSSSASLLGKARKNELGGMPAAQAISAVVVPSYLFFKNSFTAARSIFCCVKSPLACLPRSGISITLPKVYL